MISLKLLLAGFYVEFLTIWHWRLSGLRGGGEVKLLSWTSKIVEVKDEPLCEKTGHSEPWTSLAAYNFEHLYFWIHINSYHAQWLVSYATKMCFPVAISVAVSKTKSETSLSFQLFNLRQSAPVAPPTQL